MTNNDQIHRSRDSQRKLIMEELKFFTPLEAGAIETHEIFLDYKSAGFTSEEALTLVGIMFVVVIATFEWSSLKIINKIPRADLLVIVAVTLITVFTDLAIAVVCGVIISSLPKNSLV